MWLQVLKALLKILLALLSKPKKEEVKKDLPQATQVGDTQVVQVVMEEEPITQPTQTIVEPIQEKKKKPFQIIKSYLLPNQYVQDNKFVPNQIVLHHTAGGSAGSTIRYWGSNKERVCTHFIIDRNGDVFQCIPLDKSWGYHLYVASPGNKIDRKYKKLGSKYDAQSIGIELCSYGPCTLYQGQFINTYGKAMNSDLIEKLNKPFRGYEYFEKYTQEQVDSLKELLLYLLRMYPKIASGLRSEYAGQFEINTDALEMKPGIYSHTNYRTDKSDIFDYSSVTDMLNQLRQNINI